MPPHIVSSEQGPCGDTEVLTITNCLATIAPPADENPIVIHPKRFATNGLPKKKLVEEMLPYGYREGQQIKDHTLERVRKKLGASRIDVTGYTRDHVATFMSVIMTRRKSKADGYVTTYHGKAGIIAAYCTTREGEDRQQVHKF